jgi:hypothetical protein
MLASVPNVQNRTTRKIRGKGFLPSNPWKTPQLKGTHYPGLTKNKT